MAKKEEISKAELYRKERKERLAKEAKKNAKRSAQSAKMKRMAISAVAVVVAVAIIAGASLAILNSVGSWAVAEMGDIQFSASEFQYYYRTSHANLVSQAAQTDQQYGAGYYKATQGYDYAVLPADQAFPNDMLKEAGEDLDITFETWDDYLTYKTFESLQYFNALAIEAEKAGISLTEAETKEVTDQIDELRKTAEESQRTLDSFLKISYGSGINEKKLTKWMLRDALAQKYAMEKQEEVLGSITAEEILADYKEAPEKYNQLDLRTYVFEVEAGEIKDGTSEKEAKEKQEKAEAKAKKEAEEFINSIKSEEDFIEAAKKLDKEAGAKEEDLKNDTTLLEKCMYDQLIQYFGEKEADWLFDTSRKAGEKKVIAYTENGTTTNYFAVYITKPAYRDDSITSDLKGYTFSYGTTTDKDKKAEIKALAEKLVKEWNELPAAEKTAEEFAHLISHIAADQASTYACRDYADYANILNDDIDKWAADSSRKHNDVKLFEDAQGLYVMYYDAKNTEANWQITARQTIGNEKFNAFGEELIGSDDYELVEDKGLMKIKINLKKSSMNKDMKMYLYNVTQSMAQQNSYTY